MQIRMNPINLFLILAFMVFAYDVFDKSSVPSALGMVVSLAMLYVINA
jgi:hypothetical protein